MLHLLARRELEKEYDDRKSRKLVKKLVKQQEKNWSVEQQRRLEQEEKDAAFARELQEQLASDEQSIHSDVVYAVSSTPSPMTNYGMGIHTRISSSPPPLPAKPSAYNSHSESSSSSYPVSQYAILPSPYQNGQPPLPPRQKTVSQLSQYSPSSVTTYHGSPNPAAAIEIGYYSGIAQPIQHRDPVMMIIPPPLNQLYPEHTQTTYSSSFGSPSIMPMPEPEPEFTRNAPFQQYSPYNQPIGSTTAVPHDYPMYMSTSTASSSSSYYSLPGGTTCNMLNGTTISTAAATSSAPEPPHSLPTITMKPDAKSDIIPDVKPDVKPENEENHTTTRTFATTTTSNSSNLISPPQHTTAMVTPAEDSDDDDSMFWTCNDGRMMASSPTGSKSTTDGKISTTRGEKHMIPTAARELDDDSASGSENGGDGDDTAIDPFDIMDSDKVIIHQHNNANATLSSLSSSSSLSSIHSTSNSNSNSNSNNNIDTTAGEHSYDEDPFADSFAVESTKMTSHQQQQLFETTKNSIHSSTTTTPAPTLPWKSSRFVSSSVSMSAVAPPPPPASPFLCATLRRPASVHQ